MMKPILVTGATGRVGSRFVPRLLQRGQAVRLLVHRAEQAEAFRTWRVEVVEGDKVPYFHGIGSHKSKE